MDAGDEIFLNYGYCSNQQNGSPDWAKTIPKTSDFEAAAKIAMSLHEQVEKRTKSQGIVQGTE